jgi:hypothetical protein
MNRKESSGCRTARLCFAARATYFIPATIHAGCTEFIPPAVIDQEGEHFSASYQGW